MQDAGDVLFRLYGNTCYVFADQGIRREYELVVAVDADADDQTVVREQQVQVVGQAREALTVGRWCRWQKDYFAEFFRSAVPFLTAFGSPSVSCLIDFNVLATPLT